MDKSRPRADVITIRDIAQARGMPVEQLLEDMCRNALMIRKDDGSYAPTNYAIQTGALVFVGQGDADDDGGNQDNGGDDAKTGWDIDIDLD